MRLETTLLIAGLAAFAPALAAQRSTLTVAPPSALTSNDIVDTAIAAGNFTTLVTAVKAAGLVETLKGSGPFTVFAPSDDAFAKIDAATLKTLLKPENRAKLTQILTYHVVPGRVPASAVVEAGSLTTVSGIGARVKATNAAVMVGGAQVIKADIECSNGLIHVVDTVMMPPGIVDIAQQAGMFNTLLKAAAAAGLVGALQGDGPLTILAPTDEAFAKLDPATVRSLLEPANKAKLAAILKYHVIAGAVDARGAITAGEAKTLQGGEVEFSISNGRMMVNGANVIMTDLRARNGVVHVIDSVILPN